MMNKSEYETRRPISPLQRLYNIEKTLFPDMLPPRLKFFIVVMNSYSALKSPAFSAILSQVVGSSALGASAVGALPERV